MEQICDLSVSLVVICKR